MTRSFDGTPVDADWLEALCASALWAPTAGNSAGVRLNVVASEHVRQFFEVATDKSWREQSRRFEGLSRAGAVVLVTTRPHDYVERYGEPDKVASGLSDVDAWPIPYWHADAAMAAMALLLLLEESDWQATIWGSFRHDQELLAWANIIDEELFASVIIGRADGNDVASPSLNRYVPTRRERVRRTPQS